MSDETRLDSEERAEPKWQPLGRIDRRVAGVLIEKAKTTPSAYPLTINAITTGCNQKSNRFPTMQLGTEEVEESLDRLRRLGVVGQIEGYGRVDKFRHYLYEWLGVEKVELSVMAELLLRGAQTVGELRGRAARMDSIADLSALRPLVRSLTDKGLVVSLTPEGRGHVVTHALYSPKELEKIRAEYGSMSGSTPRDESATPETPQRAATVPSPTAPAPADGAARELEELRTQVTQLRSDLDDLAATQQQTADELRRLREDLGA